MGVVNERVGTLTAGGTGYDLRLAGWRSTPYRPSYRIVFPEYQNVEGVEGKVSGDPLVRQWHMSDWSGGEGKDWWKPGFYHKSTNVRPVPVGEGLVLGAYRQVTQDDNGTPADFAQCTRFGLAQGKLWGCLQATVHEWQPSTENWDETGTATGAGGVATSIVDAQDGTNLLIGTAANEIEKVAPGGANSTLVTGLAYDPVLHVYGGVVYCLVGDDLYTVNPATGLSATAVAEPSGSSVNYLTTTPVVTYGRLSASDKGPIWFQRLDSGETYIWEYNQANDTAAIIGQLPVNFAFPYSIFFSNGFVFVGFRYAGAHTERGTAHIYFQRGSSTSQSGVSPPVREWSGGGTASEAVLIAGVIGDDLIFYYNGYLWAYNLSAGGTYQIAAVATTATNVREAITFGKDIFVSNVSGAGKVERFQTDEYTTDTATINLGRSDLGYMGVVKTLLSVTVVTDALPANTAVTLKQSVNGGTFTAVTGTHDTDGAKSYTWTVSSSTASVVGEDFGLQLGLSSTVSTSTPTVRSVTARAIGAEKQRSWVLELDAGSWLTGRGGAAPRSSDVLADFRTWAETAGVVKFTNPWDVEEWDTGTDYEVVVEVAELVEAEAEEDPVILVRLREAAYV